MPIIRVLAVVLIVAVLLLVALTLRRRYLSRGNGTIDLSVRLRHGPGGRGWALGVGRYVGDDLLWYRAFRFTPRPARVLNRGDLQVVARRDPDGGEVWAVQSGAVIIECLDGDQPLQIAMSGEALTGFLSWLQSQPPGYQVPGYAAG